MAARKHIVYFEIMGIIEEFKRIIAEQGDIEMTQLAYDMPDDALQAQFDTAVGYQIRGNRTALPEAFSGHRDFIARCPNLLAISTSGAGYEVVNVDDCTEAGVAVVNQAGTNAEGVAEHALAQMMCLSRQMIQSDKAMRRDRDWVRRDFAGHNISGKTVGIMGMGAIGQTLATFCKAFGMRVLTSHPRLTAEEAGCRGAELVDFDELLASSDFVAVAMPRNAETEGMFDARAFAQMKPTAFFVTVGRGGIHVDDDLVDALDNGVIAGAGVDVWLVEPPALDHPLLRFDNVLATPHNAGMTWENWLKMAQGAATQWVQILNGERPPRLVNPEVWPHYAERFEAIMGHPVQEGDAA